MGLADWTVYRNQASLQAFIDTSSPMAIKWDTFGDTYEGRIDKTQIFLT